MDDVTFADRAEGGRLLAGRLRGLSRHHPVVLGLPRGGVLVAAEIAHALDAPLDVLVVRKLGCPWHPELGFGAIGEDGVRIIDDDLVRALRLRPTEIEEVGAREQTELERRVRRYRGEHLPLDLEGRSVILVDDGIATGATMKAAVDVARLRGAAHVVVAVPVSSRDASRELSSIADELVSLERPETFQAIGGFYGDFTQTTDDEVVAALGAAKPPAA
ncbi:MAG: phosphoribosyltransferase family protein [Nitriliruptoraceae bacterium]